MIKNGGIMSSWTGDSNCFYAENEAMDSSKAEYAREIVAKGLKLYDCAFNEASLFITNKFYFSFLKLLLGAFLG